LNFTGWRGAWIAFDRDMQGKPEEGMDEMRVTAPATNAGELFFDHIMLSSLQDVRQHTADFQAPYINPETETHWLILLRSWQKSFDLAANAEVTQGEMKSISEIQNRLMEMLLEGKKATPFQKLTDALNAYNIHKNADGTYCGLPVFFERYGETYEHLGAENYKVLFANPMGLSQCNQLLFNMAVSYQRSTNPSEKQAIADMYVLLIRHFLDQGFQAGSALGTLHHLGYSMRDFYTAAFLMKEPLIKAELDQEVQQSMEWFAGTGEVKTKPTEAGMEIDAFNTSLIGRFASILMLNDTPEKTRYLYAFSRWIDNGFLYTDGTIDAFKPDGSIYHHRGNYPAYAVGGLEGAVTANYLLYNTDFQLKPLGREHLKNALLAMRNYCNLQTWPLSLSGRHPEGKGHLFPEHYALLALTGTPDYSAKIDKELAAAYLRLETKTSTKFIKQFKNLGIEPETAPSGNWSYNYSCLNVHRRDNWSVTAMGFSRYLWATETYVGANMYGRYLNHGNLQIMANGNPISNYGSGFNQQGWDWNHFPGTTEAVLPMKELRADVKNLDADSGYEEMLLSDESYAGSLSFQNKQGLFAMKLHENPKYNGSFHARKSFFFFDNRVVALGTGICSDLPGKPVNTTLFQVYLPKPEAAIFINGTEVREFPYAKRLENSSNYFFDGLTNYFFVKQGNVLVTKSLQNSLDQETDKPTQNNFALAAIDHGVAPRNASYEYMVLVQPTNKEVQTVTKALSLKNKMPYMVLEQDSSAHIVYDKATGTTGYALFEAGKVNVKTDITFASSACMIMTSTSKSNQLAISVCDPDLHFYGGKADVKRDSAGNPIERSVYSMPWINNPSAVSVIEVQLRGNWKIIGRSDYIQVKNVEKGTTTLAVKCQHAFSREAILEKQ
jgi:chondroitin-sulfate-ABC endolyase/exolyase